MGDLLIVGVHADAVGPMSVGIAPVFGASAYWIFAVDLDLIDTILLD